MSVIKTRTTWFGAGMLLAFFSAAPTFADDTELFVGNAAATPNIRPNVLFVLDTSGSMGTNVVTQVPYDPAVPYPGGCIANRVYWRRDTGNPPGCGTSRWFNAAALQCLAATKAFGVAGFYTDNMGQFDDSLDDRWERIIDSQKDRLIECSDDSGIHGDGNPARLYAQSGDPANPWSNNSNDEIAWGLLPTDYVYTVYSGNYLNWYYNAPTISMSRLNIMKQVVNDLLTTTNGINVGLMRFNIEDGGPVIHAMENISTARAAMQATVNALPANGWTPLSETMYEAGLYYMGGSVDYGDVGDPDLSIANSRMGANPAAYDSPIDFGCQKNFVVMLTDGEPTRDVGADVDIEGLTGFAAATGAATCDANGGNNGNGDCLDDMAQYLFETDLSGGIADTQNVITYTIGFDIDLPILDATATKGGGVYYTADDTASLSTTLTNIVTSILDDNTTFTAPTVPVNTFNRTQTLNDLYVTVFAPSAQEQWPGNLKKYKLVDGIIVGTDTTTTAVDAATGFFKDSAQNYWNDGTVDGADVTLGGSPINLPLSINRNLYTYLGNSDLTAPSNAVDTGNVAMTDALFGVGGPGDPALNDLIRWARGLDLTDEDQDNDFTDERQAMGDPLHSKPVTVIYGGVPAAPDINDALIFVGTNDGYLHAIDPLTGQEAWSFIPEELLTNLRDLYINNATPFKNYGIDGNLTVQRLDLNNNGVIEAGDKVYLYFGLRRGGSSYYALDVTLPNNPQLMWIHDSGTLPGLGQTWSTPTPTRVDVNGVAQNGENLALIFGGGYDASQDNPGYSTDAQGNGVYIIDAVNGNLLWRAGLDAGANLQLLEMENSIPSDVRVIDLNSDQFADRMYVADTGGRLFRFDLFNGQAPNALVNGGMIATLGAADIAGPVNADTRRFFYAPDIALAHTEDRTFLNIAIGSGYRSHPFDTAIQDQFFSIRDPNAFNSLSQPQYNALAASPVTPADLVDITDDPAPTLLPDVQGWRLELRDPGFRGEKVLAEARTFSNTVLFTTFTPGAGGAANSCVPTRGLNRLYAISVFDGRPVNDEDADGNLDEDDRSYDLAQGGIAPEVVILFPSPDDPDNCQGDECRPDPVGCVGLECFPPPFVNRPVRTFWTQQGVD